MIFAFILDGYVYLMQRGGTPSYTGLETINVMGVFDDPSVAEEFINCDGTSCYNKDSDFPIERWMLVDIEKYIIDSYIGSEANTSEDDSLDNDNSNKLRTK
jgi:hypothetical protein